MSNQQQGIIKADDVIIGPTVRNKMNTTDAVGLSFHTEKSKAIKHAVYELIERNILARIWYENHPLIKLTEINYGNINYLAFTIKLNQPLPFVMSVIYENRYKFLCLGASFSDSTHEALLKSKSEAIMLSHDIINNKNNNYLENKDSRDKMKSQSNQLISKQRMNYILSRCDMSENIEKYDITSSIENSLASLDVQDNEISYSILHESNFGYLIRAVSNKIISLKSYRRRFYGTKNYILDPVC